MRSLNLLGALVRRSSSNSTSGTGDEEERVLRARRVTEEDKALDEVASRQADRRHRVDREDLAAIGRESRNSDDQIRQGHLDDVAHDLNAAVAAVSLLDRLSRHQSCDLAVNDLDARLNSAREQVDDVVLLLESP